MTGAGLILTYHRIGLDDVDPWALQVSPTHFREHLAVLSALGDIVPLDQVADDRSGLRFSLTFDDGYADTLHRLREDLERHDHPATVFITSDYVGKKQEYWWDALDVLLDKADASDERAGAPRAAVPARPWRAWEEPHTDAQRLYQRAAASARSEGSSARLVEEHLGPASRWPLRGSRRVVSLEELVTLSGCPLLSFGSHTRTHPQLSVLPIGAQWDELSGAHRFLAEAIARPISSVAYPFGQLDDFTDHTVALVARLGAHYACANFTGRISRDTQPLRLPRWQVHDCDGDEFEEHVLRLVA